MHFSAVKTTQFWIFTHTFHVRSVTLTRLPVRRCTGRCSAAQRSHNEWMIKVHSPIGSVAGSSVKKPLNTCASNALRIAYPGHAIVRIYAKPKVNRTVNYTTHLSGALHIAYPYQGTQYATHTIRTVTIHNKFQMYCVLHILAMVYGEYASMQKPW